MTAPSSKRRTSGSSQGQSRRAWVERHADRLIPPALGPHREQVLYLAVGAWNTAFGYGVFVVLYYLVGERVGVSAVLVASYVLAVLSAYVAYRYVTFRSHGSVLQEFPRFSAVYLLALIANLVFLPVALRLLPLSTYVVQALFTVGVVIVSYVGHRRFSFRVRAADDAPANSPRRPEFDAGPVAHLDDPAPGGE
jgi:putative flippase GtrA